jgi:5-formyltetrahydrofolate cyclo-ligase
VQRRRVPYGVAVQPDSEPIEVAKNRLRMTLLAARRARPESARQAARDAMSLHVRHALAGMQCIAAYLPLPTEPLDAAALDVLAGGARVLVPVVAGAAPLDWCEYLGNHPTAAEPTRRGALGIDEPTGPRLGPSAIADADAILVPALAVDRGGHRLGRGGGHYDRTLGLLSRLRGPNALPTRIALIYDDELLPEVPFDELDQLMTAVISPGSGLSQLSG